MTSAPADRHLRCSICSQLSDKEDAVEHVQGDEDDTVLPEAAKQLEVDREIQSNLNLLRCPECGTCYLWRSTYEFLVGFGGSYDEYFLWRLTDEVAADYREGRRTNPLPGME